MHHLFVTSAPAPPTGIAGLMCEAMTFWVPPQYWLPGLWYYVNIPRGIYFYKEGGYDSQQVPIVQGF